MQPEFVTRLKASPRPILMEIKRRSPCGSDLFMGREPEDIVEAYVRLDPPCLSVVTGRWFGGDLELLASVRAATDLPLLVKDFVTTRRQLDRIVGAGANAVLLTAALLPRDGLETLAEAARERGLVAFVEVASADESARVRPAESTVVAVNNKNIEQRERNPAALERSLSLLPDLRAAGHRCLVSASGIDDPNQAAALIAHGFDGLLIGSALLTASSPQAWVTAYERASQGGLAA